MDAEEASRYADRLIALHDRGAFAVMWDARSAAAQVRILRVLADRAAHAAPDGLHHREYRTVDAELDTLLCGVVEAVRHRLPGRDKIARRALHTLGRRAGAAPWRLAQIIRMGS